MSIQFVTSHFLHDSLPTQFYDSRIEGIAIRDYFGNNGHRDRARNRIENDSHNTYDKGLSNDNSNITLNKETTTNVWFLNVFLFLL